MPDMRLVNYREAMIVNILWVYRGVFEALLSNSKIS